MSADKKKIMENIQPELQVVHPFYLFGLFVVAKQVCEGLAEDHRLGSSKYAWMRIALSKQNRKN